PGRAPARALPSFPTRRSSDLCSWPFTNHDIQLIVFHGRIEHFLPRRTQAMDLVDKQDVTFLEVGEHGSQVSGLFQYRAGRRLDRSEEHTSELQSREKLVCRLR